MSDELKAGDDELKAGDRVIVIGRSGPEVCEVRGPQYDLYASPEYRTLYLLPEHEGRIWWRWPECAAGMEPCNSVDAAALSLYLCHEVNTQGATLPEALRNLADAVELAEEPDEKPAPMGGEWDKDGWLYFADADGPYALHATRPRRTLAGI